MAQPQSGTGATPPTDIFRRKLPVPPALAAFDSEAGQELFTKALAGGTMKCFFSLIQQYRTQDEPAFCGISTLVMVLNTLCIDPKRVWKGVWRWYHEAMLNCCSPLEEVKKKGIDIFEFKCLAICNGLDPQVFVNSFEEQGSLSKFREAVEECSRVGSSEKVLVVSYSRKAFGQTGDGHFSPIGGYCKEEDAILVLDVARFKYPAHWVRVEDMWRAMQRKDPSTDKPRGYFIFAPSQFHSALLSMLKRNVWTAITEFSARLSAVKCNKRMCGNPVASFVDQIPAKLLERMKTFHMAEEHECLAFCDQDQKVVLEELMREMQGLDVYQRVMLELERAEAEQAVFCVTILFLAYPFPTEFCTEFCDAPKLQDITHCSESFVKEIQVISKQISALLEFKQISFTPAEACSCKRQR